MDQEYDMYIEWHTNVCLNEEVICNLVCKLGGLFCLKKKLEVFDLAQYFIWLLLYRLTPIISDDPRRLAKKPRRTVVLICFGTTAPLAVSKQRSATVRCRFLWNNRG